MARRRNPSDVIGVPGRMSEVMSSLFFILFLAYPSRTHGTGPPATAFELDAVCDQRSEVIVVADGSSGWYGQAATRMISELKAVMGSCDALRSLVSTQNLFCSVASPCEAFAGILWLLGRGCRCETPWKRAWCNYWMP